MDYSLEMSYNSYLLESMLQQGRMETYIQEALILTEGVDVVSRLTSLNEGVGGKMKEVYQNFVAFIKKIFAKFTENMTKILDTNKGWLEKYQKIILTKKFDLEVSCRAYQLDRIIKYQIPIFNYSQLNDKLTSKGAFMNHIFGSAFPANNNTDDLNGWLKAHYCNGSEETVAFNNPNMRELYDYCHDFKDVTLPKLKQYQSNIEKSANNAQSLINTAIKNSADAAASAAAADKAKEATPAAGDTANLPAGKAEMKESVDLFATSTRVYSRLLEDSVEIKDKDPKPAVPSTDAAKKFSSNVPTAKDTTGGESQETAAAAVSNDNELTDKKVSEIIANYTTVASAITGAAITVAEWAYKDYMKILRAHVKKYVGDESAANNTAAAAAEDHSGGQPQQQQAAQQPAAAAAQPAASTPPSQTNDTTKSGKRNRR